MRRVAASFIAMTAGWAAMSFAGGFFFTSQAGGSIEGVLGWALWFGFFASFVVGAAWLVIYLPVYAFMPTGSAFWRWEVCVPAGLLTGALVPVALFSFLEGGVQEAGMFISLAAIVGGVAAAVGRWLYPWSRHYAEERPWGKVDEGRRIPWLRT